MKTLSQPLLKERLEHTIDQLGPHLEKARLKVYGYERDDGPVLTPRRRAFYDAARSDYRQLSQVLRALQALSDMHGASIDPGVLAFVTTARQARLLLIGWFSSQEDDRRALAKAFITSELLFKAASAKLLELAGPLVSPKTAALETALDSLGSKYLKQYYGYFPTPPAVAGDVVALANIGRHDSILEPSAGSGALADVIREQHPNNPLTLLELSSDLRQVLELKGFEVDSTYNFLEYEGGPFDRVLMNPPFTKAKDELEHVLHAYELLGRGGRLVTVLPVNWDDERKPMPRALMRIVARQGGYRRDNAPGAFRRSGTMIRTEILMIDKE